jgi:hypothetical protein
MARVNRLLTLALGFMFLASTLPASSGSIHRRLRRMIGFTIISSDSVADVFESKGEKYVKLLSGATFKVEMVVMDPLTASDVIVFGKRFPEALAKQYPSLPNHLLSSTGS